MPVPYTPGKTKLPPTSAAPEPTGVVPYTPPTGVEDIPFEERYKLEEFLQTVTPEERVALAVEAGAQERSAMAMAGEEDTALKLARERWGAANPSAQPGLMESAARMVLPRTTVQRDPRAELATIARSELNPQLDEYLMSVMGPEAKEALGGDITAYRQGQQKQALQTLVDVGDIGTTASRRLLRNTGPGWVARKKFGDEAVDEFLDQYLPAPSELLTQQRIDAAFPEATRAEQEPTLAGDAGVPLESQPQALIRSMGLLAALGQETAAALPSVGLTYKEAEGLGALNRMALEAGLRRREGESVGEALRGVAADVGVSRMPLARSVLGVTPEDRGLLSEDSLVGRDWASKVLLRSMHKTEQGAGLAEDIEATAELFTRQIENELPELAENERWQAAKERAHTYAWRMGLAGDLAVPWEAPIGKGAKAARAVGKLAKATGQSKAAAAGHILGGNRLDAPDMQAQAVAARLEGGKETVDDILEELPEDLRAAIDDLMEVEAPPVEAPDLTMRTPDVEAPPVKPAPEPPSTKRPGEVSTMREYRQLRAKDIVPAKEAPLPELDQRVAFMGRAPDKVSPRNVESWNVTMKRAMQPDEKQRLVDNGFAVIYNEKISTPKARQYTIRWSPPKPRQRRAPKSGGHEAMRWQELDRTVQTPEYRLLGEVDGVPGRVVAEGDLEKMAKLMDKRQMRKDVLQFRDSRDVATWSSKGDLKADWSFAAPDEHKLLKELPYTPLVKTDGSGLSPDAARKLFGDWIVDEPLRPMREFVAAFQGKVAGPKVRHLDARDREFVDAYEQALRARVRSTFGTEDLISPVAGVTLAREEWQPIAQRLNKVADAAGWDPRKVAKNAEQVDGQTVLRLDEGDIKGLDTYATAFGRSIVARDGMPLSEVYTMMEDIVEEAASRVSDQRLALRESGNWSNALMTAINTAGRDPSAVYRRAKDLDLPWFDNDAMLRMMDKGARVTFDAARTRLKNIGRELVFDLRRTQGTPAERLGQVLKDFRPVTRAEDNLLEEVSALIDKASESGDVTFITDAQNLVLDRVGASLRSTNPALYETNRQQALAGLVRYRAARNAQKEKLGEQVLRAAAPRGLNVDTRRLRKVTAEEKRRAWAAYRDNGFDDPFFDELFTNNRLYGAGMRGGARPDVTDQQLLLALELKRDQVVRDVAEDLARAKVGVTDQRTADIVEHVLRGGTETEEFTRVEVARARNYLAKMGVQPSPTGDWTMKKFGEDLWVPEGIVTELQRQIDMGVKFENKAIQRVREGLEQGDAVTVLRGVGEGLTPATRAVLGLHKDLLTTVNPAYHLTNFMGIPFIAINQLGVAGGLRATGRMAANLAGYGRHPELTRELTRRMANGPRYKPSNQRAEVLVTDDGRMYDADMLEREMLRRDVGTSLQIADNSRALRKDLEREAYQGDGLGEWLARSGETLRDSTVAVSDTGERMFRVGVFLDELKKGASLDEAALLSKQSLYDYGALTIFEQSVMRTAVMFYAFHRKNTEAFVRNLIDNPERLMMAIRAGQRQQESQAEGNLNKRTGDLTRFVLANIEKDAQAGRDETIRIQSGAINSQAEGAVMLNRLAGAVLGLGTGNMRPAAELAQLSNPFVDVFGRLVLDVDVGTGFRASTPGGSAIPEWMAAGGAAVPDELLELMQDVGLGFMIDPFNIKDRGPMPQQMRQKYTHLVGAQPKRYEATGKYGKMLWQAQRAFSGRVTGDTIPDAMVGLSVFAPLLNRAGVTTPEQWAAVGTERGLGTDAAGTAAKLMQAAGLLVSPVDADPLTTARTRQASEMRKAAADAKAETEVQ